MEAADQVRLVWAYRGRILVGAALGGLVTFVILTLLPATYASSSTLRVVPPAGTLDAPSLATAVAWYAALGDVPDVLTDAGAGLSPPLDAATVDRRTTVTAGDGPGELVVTGVGASPEAARLLSDALAGAMVDRVRLDEGVRIGNTGLEVLVPAADGGRTGLSPVTTSVAVFLLLLVVAVTWVALFGSRSNWRMPVGAIRELARSRGLMALDAGASTRREAAAYLVGLGRQGPLALVWAAAPSARAEKQVDALGEAFGLLRAGSGGHVPAGAHELTVLPVQDVSALAVSAPAEGGVQVIVAVPTGAKRRVVSSFLTELEYLHTTVVAVVAAGSRGREPGSSPARDPEAASGPRG